jgi:hypothetical protein
MVLFALSGVRSETTNADEGQAPGIVLLLVLTTLRLRCVSARNVYFLPTIANDQPVCNGKISCGPRG